jgi:BlaI family penicillinase repressor
MERAVPQPRLTDAEFAVLEALWQGGTQTIRDITSRLYPEGSVSDYATVQKLLERLEHKQCVRRDRTSHAHVFRACQNREDLIDAQLRQMAEKLCDGSLTPVLLRLVRRAKLTKKDRELIRKMIDDTRPDGGSR